jgi:hypothetical protein
VFVWRNRAIKEQALRINPHINTRSVVREKTGQIKPGDLNLFLCSRSEERWVPGSPFGYHLLLLSPGE